MDSTALNAHYTKYRYQAKTFNINFGLDFIEGNIIKYIARAEDKGEKIKDIRKALDYIDTIRKVTDRAPKLKDNNFNHAEFIADAFNFASQFKEWQQATIIYVCMYLLTQKDYFIDNARKVLSAELSAVHAGDVGIFSE